MAKKKSFMDRMNILSEGFFDGMKKAIKRGRLKKNKKIQHMIDDMNKDTEEFEDLYNELMRAEYPNHKDVKLTRKNIEDFV